MTNQWKLVILMVLQGFPAAADSSRPAGSIGEVRFHIRIAYTSQKPLQGSDFLHFPAPKPEKILELYQRRPQTKINKN